MFIDPKLMIFNRVMHFMNVITRVLRQFVHALSDFRDKLPQHLLTNVHLQLFLLSSHDT